MFSRNHPGASNEAKKLGWLLTGDAALSHKYILNDFKTYFHGILPMVGFFMIPHHGSKRNMIDESFAAIGSHEISYINAGDRTHYKHPNKEIINILNQKGLRIRISYLSEKQLKQF